MACGAGDFNCRLDAIIAALHGSADGWEIAGVLVAGIGVIASTAVAIVAYLASRRAVDIAAASDAREAVRDDERQRERVDRWLADFIHAATAYWTDCDAWVKEHENRAFRLRMGARYVPDPDPIPRAAPMLGALDAARLVARGNDRVYLQSVSDAVVALRDVGVGYRGPVMNVLISGVRDWRSSKIEGENLQNRLRDAVADARSAAGVQGDNV